VSIDPWGDRKSKFYANFGRYAYQTPLDAAIRSLSSELDLGSLDFAPVVNGPGSVTAVLDQAHLVNGAAGGTATVPTTSAQTGTGFAPGARLQYQDEYLVGFERELKAGVVFSARYIDRRLRRNLEDVAGVSPEGFNAGITQNYFLGNPSRTTDYFHNESPVFYNGSTLAVNAPVACKDPQVGVSATDPAPFVNAPITDANGNVYTNGPGANLCFAAQGVDPTTGLTIFGGEPGSDGRPDGFPDPVRNYQAVEIELNKSFSKGWMMRANYRIARNQGN
jgi:hypothetical protein